jgi:hypothetical protein
MEVSSVQAAVTRLAGSTAGRFAVADSFAAGCAVARI